MLCCPNCKRRLALSAYGRPALWICNRCKGRAARVAALNKVVPRWMIQELYDQARAPGPVGTRPCPACEKLMAPVPVVSVGQRVQLDFCLRCHLIWFDAKELEQISSPSQADQPGALASIKDSLLYEVDTAPPAERWERLLGFLGLPVPAEDASPERRPLATWILSATIFAVAIWGLQTAPASFSNFGLVPAQALRYGGATLLISFFLHGSVIHMLGNLYFFLTFGENVEDFLGVRRFLSLILVATLLGDALHILISTNSEIPCVGASGGISGVLVFYGLEYPHAKIGLFLLWTWLRVPAYLALIWWVLLQTLGAGLQVAGVTGVSFAAHLGGALAGLLFWCLYGRR